MSNEVNSAAVNNSNGVCPEGLEKRINVKGAEEMSKTELRITKEQFEALKPHPYAEFLPMIATKREVEALKEGIRKHGLLEPITIHDGMILDGRNRHRAICELIYEKDFKYGEKVRFAPVPENFSPEQYVITRNLHRRNLNESQRALFAGRMLWVFNDDKTLGKTEKTKLPEGNKTDHFGKMFNVSGSSVKSAQTVIKKGLPIIEEFVQKGAWRLGLAKKIAELPTKEQEQLVPEALKLGQVLATKWYNKSVLDLNSQEVKLRNSLSEEEEKRNVLADTLRQKLAQELTDASRLPEEDRTPKIADINERRDTIEKGSHSDLKSFTSKIEKYSERLNSCQQTLKKMLEDEANQKELYAHSKLAQCMIGAYKQHMRSKNKASLVVAMNFSGTTPDVEFKVVPAKQAGKYLGMIKEFSNPGEGEQFLADNKAKLDALKIEIMNGLLVDAPVKIQAFAECLTDSNAA